VGRYYSLQAIRKLKYLHCQVYFILYKFCQRTNRKSVKLAKFAKKFVVAHIADCVFRYIYMYIPKNTCIYFSSKRQPRNKKWATTINTQTKLCGGQNKNTKKQQNTKEKKIKLLPNLRHVCFWNLNFTWLLVFCCSHFYSLYHKNLSLCVFVECVLCVWCVSERVKIH